MIKLGITGSVGMGKSVIAAMLETLGVPVHDSDKAAHQALSSKGKAFEIVAVTFPECWDKKNHVIRRDVLGDIVFADDDKRKELESLIHPAVWDSQNDFIKKHKRLGQKIVAFDIPLLFETGAEKRMDYTVLADAPYEIQRQRVLQRPLMDEEKFLSIVNSQMPNEQKAALADFVIPTGLGRAHTMRVLKDVLKEIKMRKTVKNYA